MYKKMKYMVYVIFFLMIVFMTMVLFTQSKQNSTQKNTQDTAKQESEQKTEVSVQQTEAEMPLETQEKTYTGKSTINNTLSFNAKDVPLQKEKTKEQSADMTREHYYLIRSSKFTTINTQYDKDFGIITKDVSGTNNSAVAQQLNKNSILLYIFDNSQKVVYKKLIKNDTNIEVKPFFLSFNGKNMTLKIQENTKKSNPNIQTFEFKEAEAPDSDWDIVLAGTSETKPGVVYMNNTPATRYQVINKVKLKDTNFYIVSYLNPKLYQNPGYINRSFYIYREDNGKLTNVYHLFNRSNKANEDVNNVIEYTIQGSELWVGHKGNGNLIRKIPIERLFSTYSKVPSEAIRFAPKAYVTETDTDISIIDVSPSMIKN